MGGLKEWVCSNPRPPTVSIPLLRPSLSLSSPPSLSLKVKASNVPLAPTSSSTSSSSSQGQAEETICSPSLHAAQNYFQSYAFKAETFSTLTKNECHVMRIRMGQMEASHSSQIKSG